MKRQFVALSLIAASTTLFALDCGNLGITIVNNSPHHCVLKHTVLDGGYFQNQAPLSVPSGSSMPTFYMAQGDNGVDVEFDYRCDGKVVVIGAHQDYCGFMAGYVVGQAYFGNDLVTEHQETIGSYWSETPGQITWTIH